MRATLSAQPRILAVWRIFLVLAALPIALFSSLFLRVGSPLWWAATCAWGVGFLFLYLFYLPAKRRGFSLEFCVDKLVLSAGVFSSVQRTIPFESIQYVRVRSSPIHRWLRLSTLVAVCAGGRIRMPGLGDGQAQRLAMSILG